MSIVPSFLSRKANKTNAIEPVSIDIWDPFEALFFAISPSFPTTRMDWKETPEAHVYIAEIPGLKKEEVKIEVEEEKILKISGQRTKESEEKNEKWHRVERSSEKFFRSVKLPSNARVDDMKAKIEDGVLTITVPKDYEKVQGGRFIQISG